MVNKVGYWRYHVGTYRLIAEIEDRKVRIVIINVAHSVIFISSGAYPSTSSTTGQ